MKHLLLPLVFASFLMLGSCKKCKDKDCQNGASCGVVNNKAECTCKDFYSGDRCENEVRNSYYGVYKGSGSLTVAGIKFPFSADNYSVEKNGGTVSKFKIVATGSGSSGALTFYCTLTSDSDFNIESVGGSTADWSGSGSISTGSISMSGTVKSTDSKGNTSSGNFSVRATR